ncbi:DNA polymerase epsilon catalytic subunit [Massospora cicadina]|nr:DNA polymerase epsilon catalytic subunit [Massospora cicadina]
MSSRDRGRRRVGRRVGHSTGGKRRGVFETIDAADEAVEGSSIRKQVGVKDDEVGKMSEAEYAIKVDRIDEKVGVLKTLICDSEFPNGRSGVDLYFINEEDEYFKCTFLYKPYFFIICKEGSHAEIEENLLRRFPNTIDGIEKLTKEDLSLVPLSYVASSLLAEPSGGIQRKVMKLVFRNSSDLLAVRKFVQPLASKNETDKHAKDAYANALLSLQGKDPVPTSAETDASYNVWCNIIGIREFDVPYLVRTAIDIDLRVGLWYTVKPNKETNYELIIQPRADLVKRADPVVLAFDIETTKSPLKFPDAAVDMVMMISYMVDGQGFLITNRQIVSEDIGDFEYTPKPDLGGHFTIFNEADERATLQRFFNHFQELRPTVVVTYNGDFFDWPFVDARAKVYGMDIEEEIGFGRDGAGEYKSSYCIHMDCLAWVKRDSYLPAGSHGLKAVTTSKLGYHPIELDPEKMVTYAQERPHELAQYSVSDAVATYHLYMKHVHPFIFSLCNIIPASPDDVLRKGSGTLCEYLLMVEAYKANVLMPNKHVDDPGKLYNGHVLESETYVGGHVEALEAGVFRSDLPVPFHIQSDGIDTLVNQLHDALKFSLQSELKVELAQVANYSSVYEDIKGKLLALRSDSPAIRNPLIYHLDVAAMYPNIILTNRLQPDAIIDDSTCASCDFNRPAKTCDRRMAWSWRGEYYPAKQGDINMIRHQLASEVFPGHNFADAPRTFQSLTPNEQHEQIKRRLTQYCRKVYNKVKETKVVERTSTVCQRENPFYIDTVRSFRDRRYEYKGLHRLWKGKLEAAMQAADAAAVEEAKKLIVVYDSLQLAHKCILNSFYGYVMRKGSRWYSMEMGGIVCLTGARIIQMARQMVEKVGRPLELDTDGIWCILPSGFPEDAVFRLHSGKQVTVSYPCTMLNHLVHAEFTNHQYQDLVDPAARKYNTRAENSIFFEVDGPYRAMILPSSTEADKLLKKRYAVFNHDGTLAELKGFEIKRRGELKLIKIFQSQIFSVFLEGATLKECYAAVAKVADRWLDLLFNKGAGVADHELFELIAENRSMSKSLAEYGDQKSTSISTAKRLAEFLGDAMVKDKGLACQFIVSRLPPDLPVSERAVPIAIFAAEPAIKNHYLRKWTRDPALDNPDIRDLLDWRYYIERFGSVIQKLITIPAAMQRVPNPVPRVPHPDWLAKRVASHDDCFQQRRITDMFKAQAQPRDMEDFGAPSAPHPVVAKVYRRPPQTAEERLAAHLAGHRPALDAPYAQWLAYQKVKWRLQREIRSQASRAPSGIPRSVPRGASGFYRAPYLTQPFHVLQVAPTDQPGLFKLWILLGSQMHALRLVVPRTLYVNSKVPDTADPANLPPEAEFTIAPSKARLPRSFPSQHLQILNMAETFYRDNADDFTALFCHHNVKGAYETHIAPMHRALLELGGVCYFKGDSSPTDPPAVFKPTDFGRELNAQAKYLADSSLSYLVLLHETHGFRHMFLLFASTLSTAYVMVVDGPRKPTPQLPNLSSLYTRYYDGFRSEHGVTQASLCPAQVTFETDFLDDPDKAWALIQRRLVQYQAKKLGPTLLLSYSPLTEELPRLARASTEFPVLTIPCAKQRPTFLALGWQQQVIHLLLGRLLSVEGWLKEQIAWAGYANLPVCNLEADTPAFLADVFFARYLRRSHAVLWWSPSDLPDLAGQELDENRLVVDQDTSLPNVDYAAAHASICFEISVDHLAANTLLNSHIINELEGSSNAFEHDAHATLDGEDEAAASFMGDHHAIHPATFAILKSLVSNWCKELVDDGCPHAEQMVKHFYRWISTPKAYLYDPRLHQMVAQYMGKLFAQLLASVQSFGGTVLHASPQRLVVGTSKISTENGVAFSEYLIHSLLSQPLFRNLGLSITQFWDRLLWMNPSNFGGIMAQPPPDLMEDAEPFDGNYKVIMSWAISNYLPPKLRVHFDAVLAKFLSDLHRNRLGFVDGLRASSARPTQAQMDWRENEVDQGVIIIRETIMPRLLELVPDLQAAMAFGSPLDAHFPNLPGSPYYQPNPQDGYHPVLEWIKAVCAALALDTRFSEEVEAMKSTLLKLIDVNPHSARAVFHLPSAAVRRLDTGARPSDKPRTVTATKEALLRFPGVVCAFCNFAWDIDFYEHMQHKVREGQPATEQHKVREGQPATKAAPVPIQANVLEDDPLVGSPPSAADAGMGAHDALDDLEAHVEGAAFTGMHCPSCSGLYPAHHIEELLMASLQRHIVADQLQDFECTKCRVIQESPLHGICPTCTLPYQPVQYPARHLIRHVQSLSSLAALYNFRRLQAQLDFVMNH